VAGANAALLSRPRWTFHTELPEWHVEFAVGGAHETLHNGVGAFEFGFPDVIVCHQPRAHPRVPIEPEAQLKCIAHPRHVSFEAHIVDISAGGVGFIVHSRHPARDGHAAARLPDPGARRRRGGGRLEVRYTKPVDAAPGSVRCAPAAAWSIVAGALALIRLYVGSES